MFLLWWVMFYTLNQKADIFNQCIYPLHPIMDEWIYTWLRKYHKLLKVITLLYTQLC